MKAREGPLYTTEIILRFFRSRNSRSGKPGRERPEKTVTGEQGKRLIVACVIAVCLSSFPLSAGSACSYLWADTYFKDI